MKKQRTHFNKAFKENAVKLSLERKNVFELAQELGIAPFLLYRWRKEFQQKGNAGFPGHGVQSLSEDAKRIADPEKRPGEAETERDILKKNFEHHLQERSLIFPFIKEYNSKEWTIEVMCKVLKVSGSSYYRRLKDPEGQRKRKRMELDEIIGDAYFATKGRNGSPRPAKDLQASGIPVSRTTIACHMKEMCLRSKLSGRFKVTTDGSHNYKVAPNLLTREFNRNEPVKACVFDLTYIPCRDGFLYLTCVGSF